MAAGVLSLTSTGKGISPNITALASVQTAMTIKWCQKVDALRAIAASSFIAFAQCDAGGGSDTKFRMDWATDGSGNIKFNCTVPSAGTISCTNAAVTNLPANGNYVICAMTITNNSQKTQIANAAGSVIAAFTNSQTINAGTNFFPITGGANGVFTLNATSTDTASAQLYAGIALYNSVLTGTSLTSAPTSGDAGIVAGWLLQDAASGTSPSTTADLVGSGLVLSGTYAWASDSSPWATAQVPTSATISPTTPTINGGATEQFTGVIKDASTNPITGEPVTWSSSSLSVATVNGSGLATSVFPGTTTIQVADVAIPTVNASTTLTVQTLALLGLSSSGSGLSGNVTGLANLQTTFSVKWCQKVDSLRTLGAALTTASSAVGFLDSDGANSNHKMTFGWNVGNTGLLNLSFHVFGGGAFAGPATSYTNLPAAGNYIICEIDAVNNLQHFNVYTVAQTQIAGLSGSTALTFSLPTSGSPGRFTLNKDNSASIYTQQANAYAGLAFYNSVLSGAGVYSAPSATDTGIQAGWYMADAASGSAVTSAAAFVGGQALALTGQTWDADSSPWAPSLGQVPTTAVITPTGATLAAPQTQQLTGVINDGNGNPIAGAGVTWTSSATGVATVSGTGLVTAVASGQTTITLASSVVTTVTATAVVTVTGIGTLSFSSSGLGLSGNVATVAGIQTAMSVKWVQETNALISLGASLGVPVMSVDQDGAGTNCKFRLGWVTGAAGTIGLVLSVPNQGTVSGPTLAQTSLPVAGNYIICEVDATGTSQHFNVYTSALSQIAGLSGSTSFNLGTNWAITPGSNGRVTVNKDPSGFFANQSALVYGGMAIYNSVLTGSGVYSVPTSQDSGIAAGWFMNDATLGSTPTTAAPFVGGQPLTLTNNTWLSNASAWAQAQVPTSATLTPGTVAITTAQTAQLTGSIFDSNGLPITGEPVTYSSSNPATAGVNTTGGVTPLAAGTTVITLADVAVPAVSATSTVTVTTALATSATLTCTPYATAGSGSPISGLVASWTTSNSAVATVGTTTGLVTGISAGSATITGTISGQSASCTVTVT